MTDVRISFQGGDIPFDIALSGADLAVDDSLESAIILSLFTDARAAEDDQLPYDGADRRGWWGDAYAEIAGDVIGSKLWLISRAKQTADVLTLARQFAQDALAWLVKDGVASAVSVTATYPRRGWIALAVEVDRPNGPNRQRFDYLWRLT